MRCLKISHYRVKIGVDLVFEVIFKEVAQLL